MSDPLKRFSNRVENYVKYRPGYPAGVIELLKTECGLTSASTIADAGSGTGILSELFLKNGNTVFAIEPNAEMRLAAERLLKGYKEFVSVGATAEATTLASESVDFVTAAQAFHWFDRNKAKREFARILRPEGWVALIWNERRLDSSPFLQSYEDLLLRHGTDYSQVRHENVTGDINEFFHPEPFNVKMLENAQYFDFESLKGRLLSSSYAPDRDHPNFKPMLAKLEELFAEHQQNGIVSFEYDTRVFYGHLNRSS
jgi:SAM-dependent methyltransferase